MKEMIRILVEFPLVLICMFVVFRLMGSKELNQSTPIDFAFMVLMTSIGWDVTISQDYTFWFTFILILLLMVMIYLFDWLTSKSKKAEKIIIGEPLLLVEQGEIIEESLKKVRVSNEEVLARLRLKGFFSLEDIELCYLEYNGDISVKLKGK
ncbi:DUF421 domain-containing protein [Lysinibacillus fusiformis]|nr:DUF421 domain-containing protein [Lysinibacillus fusiformis]